MGPKVIRGPLQHFRKCPNPILDKIVGALSDSALFSQLLLPALSDYSLLSVLVKLRGALKIDLTFSDLVHIVHLFFLIIS